MQYFVKLPRNKNDKDYVSAGEPPTYPLGLTAEVISFYTLKKCYNLATSDFDKEHVTSYLKSSGKFSILNIGCDKDYSNDYKKRKWKFHSIIYPI